MAMGVERNGEQGRLIEMDQGTKKCGEGAEPIETDELIRRLLRENAELRAQMEAAEAASERM
ncbi:hypothetical protein MMC20_007209 [Loxospora ochrophaea]|nr:hypothetical protein [Loxospora ochrophaea]